jgi:YD repeat-containing protein
VAGRLYSETLKNASLTTLASFTYTLDPGSRVTDLAQTLPAPNTQSGNWHYVYNPANEMTEADPPTGPHFLYGYDGAGNRTSVQQGTNPAVVTSYDGAGLPTSATDGTAYTFDPADELTQVVRTAQTWNYTYDSWGRTASAFGPGSNPLITYAYDPLNRMLSRAKAGVTTFYKYAGVTQDVASTTVSGASTLYAWTAGGPLAQSAAGVVKVFEPNLHGDLAVMANTSAAVTGTEAYSAWGQKVSTTGDALTSMFSFQSDPPTPTPGWWTWGPATTTRPRAGSRPGTRSSAIPGAP